MLRLILTTISTELGVYVPREMMIFIYVMLFGTYWIGYLAGVKIGGLKK